MSCAKCKLHTQILYAEFEADGSHQLVCARCTRDVDFSMALVYSNAMNKAAQELRAEQKSKGAQ
jgi:DNA-directed RNA polymerase subunit M/transcription elongation factor TFIIS